MPLTVELAERVVKAPDAAAVPPIAGGLAMYVLKPVPLTVELADKVVKAPVLGVPEPIVPGIAQVPASRVVALMVPEPEMVKLAPVPTTIAAAVLVLEVRPLKVVEAAEAPQSDPSPETTPEEFTCKHCVEPVTLVVRFPVSVMVVKLPAAGAVPPIAGGEAR